MFKNISNIQIKKSRIYDFKSFFFAMVNKQVKIFVSYLLLPNKEAVQCYIIFIS